MRVHGFCDPALAAVGEAFEHGFAERGELGAAVAVHLNGELAVDLWAGLADPANGHAWDEDTIAHAYSVSKPLVATCALLLADRGELDLDAPVARYWPEYAQAGKEATLVRHLLTHQSGLLVLAEPLPPEALLDWKRLTAALAAEPPLWEPGTRHGECAGFYGHLVGEVVRRVDGRSVGRFFAEQIAAPWGLDFHIGLGPAEQARAARLVDPGGAWRRSVHDDPRRWLEASLDNPPGMLDVDVVNSSAYRAAEIPAVNGHGTARAIARFYGGLAAGGELDGVRLLRPGAVEQALRPQASGRDELLEDDAVWSLGFRVDDGESFGLGGIGGFAGYGLRRPGVALGYGYVTCTLAGSDRTAACEDALEEALS
ncbi:MAG TPA: serine hydrolase domain-containing protein [Gaiellaceae bacterium]|nr:serine hydrolase domain-containing protein [Gaiellaceae bacterium]